MKIVKILCVIVALAGMAVLAFGAPAVYGQARRAVQEPGDPLILRGPGSQLGVTIRDTGSDDQGVVIEGVGPDGPAAKAGFRAADVVVEFDGERVRSVRQFTRLVQETPPGRTVPAVVLRDGRRTELSVTTAPGADGIITIDPGHIRAEVNRMVERLPPFEFDFEFDRRSSGTRARLGVTVLELTPDLAAYFGARDGVLVATVESDSAASRAGLLVGDVITSVNGTPVGSRIELQRLLREQREAGELTIGVVRDKKESTVTAKIEGVRRRTYSR